MRSKSTANIEGPRSDTQLDEARFLWDEYKYRHELCWKLIFQITTAVVAILVIPFVQTEITKSVGLWILAVPFLAIILVLFAMSRLKRELEILAKIRAAHRERQREVHHIMWTSDGHFTRDVMLYLTGLVLVSLAEMFALVYIWQPTNIK